MQQELSVRDKNDIVRTAFHVINSIPDKLVKAPLDEAIASHAVEIKASFPNLERQLQHIGCREKDPIQDLIKQGCNFRNGRAGVAFGYIAEIITYGA